MLKKTLLALAVVALSAGTASASAIYQVQETFQSDATFDAQLTFSNDYRQILSVDGYLDGAWYGHDHINSVYLDQSGSDGGNVMYNFLLDGPPDSYSHLITFTWDVSNAPELAFSDYLYGNTVDYGDYMTSGSITLGSQQLPEPASLALLGLGLAGLAARRRRS